MSIKVISWAFQQRLDDPTAKLVLIGIADKYNEDRGYALPSGCAGRDGRLHRADCQPQTCLLEEAKLIATIRHPTRTNRYFLPHLTFCRDDTSVGSDRTSDVCSDRTSDVSRTIINDSEQKDSIKSASEQFQRRRDKTADQRRIRSLLEGCSTQGGQEECNVAYRAAQNGGC